MENAKAETDGCASLSFFFIIVHGLVAGPFPKFSLLSHNSRLDILLTNNINIFPDICIKNEYTVELQWREHLWDHGKLFEPWVVRANEG